MAPPPHKSLRRCFFLFFVQLLFANLAVAQHSTNARRLIKSSRSKNRRTMNSCCSGRRLFGAPGASCKCPDPLPSPPPLPRPPSPLPLPPPLPPHPPPPAPPVAVGQITGCDHLNPFPSATWIRSPSVGTGPGTTSEPTCTTICGNVGKTCVRAGIKAVTVSSTNPSCQFEKCAIPGYSTCSLCGPSTSSNRYCFPGVSAGSRFYYHTSWTDSSSYTCDTAPDRTKITLCPCT